MNESSNADETGVLSRRSLFRAIGVATCGAMLLGLPRFFGAWTSHAEAAVKRTYTSGNVALELEGQFAGILSAVEGGNPFADIVPEGAGPDMIQRKRSGQPRFEDIQFDVNMSQITKPLSGWITDTLTKGPGQKNGAIVYADFQNKEVKRMEFLGGVLVEVGTPVCEGASKDQAVLSLRITPQSTRFMGASGKPIQPIGPKAKSISSSNFRFNVQGLEQACKRIIKVEAIVARRLAPQTSIGQEKFKTAPGVLDCSLVSILLPEIDGGPFYAWFDDAVLKGKQGGERAGLLEWFDPTGKSVEASAQLGGLGIVRYATEPVGAGALPVVRVDMYCETMLLTVG
jgi:hypothetical protein